MDLNQKNFYKRLHHIERRHKRLEKGAAPAITADGLLILVPTRRRIDIPWRGLLLILVAGLTFKGLVLAYVGEQNYAARLAELSAGSAVERGGAIVMWDDPVTKFLAGQFGTIIGR